MYTDLRNRDLNFEFTLLSMKTMFTPFSVLISISDKNTKKKTHTHEQMMNKELLTVVYRLKLK